MPYSESVLHSANARLALRRAAAERARQARQTEIYTKIPRVAEIDRLLESLSTLRERMGYGK